MIFTHCQYACPRTMQDLKGIEAALPAFTGVIEQFNLGNVPGGTVAITYQGAFENVTGGGPNLATLTAPVPGSNINALDGYRFIRFNINVSYAAPPVSNENNTFPTVDSIAINFRAPLNCP